MIWKPQIFLILWLTCVSAQDEIDVCQSDPCQHNGTCTTNGDDYTCSCTEEYAGSHCEHVWQSPSNNSQYVYFTVVVFGAEVDCHEAESICNSNGANLTSIHSEEENSYIASFVLNNGIWIWIGLYKLESTAFQWTDGTELNYTKWSTGQPDIMTDCSCAALDPNNIGNWSDWKCLYEKFGYSCKKERPIPTDPNPGTDITSIAYDGTDTDDTFVVILVITLLIAIIIICVCIAVIVYFRRQGQSKSDSRPMPNSNNYGYPSITNDNYANTTFNTQEPSAETYNNTSESKTETSLDIDTYDLPSYQPLYSKPIKIKKQTGDNVSDHQFELNRYSNLVAVVKPTPKAKPTGLNLVPVNMSVIEDQEHVYDTPDDGGVGEEKGESYYNVDMLKKMVDNNVIHGGVGDDEVGMEDNEIYHIDDKENNGQEEDLYNDDEILE